MRELKLVISTILVELAVLLGIAFYATDDLLLNALVAWIAVLFVMTLFGTLYLLRLFIRGRQAQSWLLGWLTFTAIMLLASITLGAVAGVLPVVGHVQLDPRSFIVTIGFALILAGSIVPAKAWLFFLTRRAESRNGRAEG